MGCLFYVSSSVFARVFGEGKSTGLEVETQRGLEATSWWPSDKFLPVEPQFPHG